ncbi:MAG: ATP-binding protein, partial [Bdellovibrionales bacterium]|nr:ATP-binding protein [Bdellovibrionales bacterium]
MTELEIVDSSSQHHGELPLYGRDEELALLIEHYRSSSIGAQKLVLLEAFSGGGKSRLLREFLAKLRGQESSPIILRAQGIHRQGAAPFQLFSQIIDSLLASKEGIDALRTIESDALTPSEITSLITALPSLEAIYSSPPEVHFEEAAFGQQRTINALSKFVSSLGTVERPVVLLIDDIQWADELTLKV